MYDFFIDIIANKLMNLCFFVQTALIFGLMGCCRCDELLKMELKDMERQGETLFVNIPKSEDKEN